MDKLIQPELALGTCKVRKNYILKLAFRWDLLFLVLCLFHMHVMKIRCIWEGPYTTVKPLCDLTYLSDPRATLTKLPSNESPPSLERHKMKYQVLSDLKYLHYCGPVPPFRIFSSLHLCSK